LEIVYDNWESMSEKQHIYKLLLLLLLYIFQFKDWVVLPSPSELRAIIPPMFPGKYCLSAKIKKRKENKTN